MTAANPYRTRSVALARLRKPIALNSMPKWRARVEIARDVLAGLRADKLTPGSAYGAVELEPHHTVRGGDELRNHLDHSTCRACALGCTLVALVARVNGFRVDGGDIFCGREIDLYRDGITRRLSEYFTEIQMDMIESAYESCVLCLPRLHLRSKAHLQALDDASLVYHHLPKADRLPAIMNNIIANRGTFKP